MSLTREQRITHDLAGTVPVPSPFPALGEIRIGSDIELGPKAQPADMLALRAIRLEIKHRISPKLRITRHVFLHQVSALFLPNNPEQVRYDDGTWVLLAELQADAFERLSRRASRQDKADRFFVGRGIVFVPEAAQVLLQVEVGMTAAQDAEYYPPLPGEWGKNPYDVCGFE